MVQPPASPDVASSLPLRALCRVRTRRGAQTMLVELHHDRVRLRDTNLAFGTALARLDGVAAIDGGVQLSAGGEAIELRGLGAVALAVALARHEAASLPGLAPPDPQEQLVGSGRARWLRAGGVAAGQLVLSTHGLRFLPWPGDPGTVTGAWSAAVLARADWSPDSGRLTLRPPGAPPVVLTGPGAALAGLCRGPAGSLPPSVLALPASCGPTTSSSGGVLVLGSEGLQHLSGGGASPEGARTTTELRWSAVAELQAVGGPRPLLHLHHSAGRLTVQVSETALVGELMRECIDRGLDPQSSPPTPSAVRGPLPSARPLATSPGRLTVETGHWRYGTLALHRKELRFQPRPGALARTQRIPTSAVSRSEAGARALVLRTRSGRLRFFVAAGAFVDRYWEEARTPDRIYHPADHRAAVLQRLCAPTGRVRVWAGDALCLDDPQLRLVPSAGGLHLILPHHHGERPATGRLLRVQVFHPDGIYELTSPVAAPTAAPAVATLELPRMVLRFDKRQDRRMVVWAPARIHRSGDPQPCLGVALNLSTSGAALRAYGGLQTGDEVELDLQLDHDQTVRIPARVVHHDPVRDCWGVRFGTLSEDAQQTLLRLARDHEQQELARHRPSGAAERPAAGSPQVVTKSPL